jgi:AraC-like DNA-binding protein
MIDKRERNLTRIRQSRFKQRMLAIDVNNRDRPHDPDQPLLARVAVRHDRLASRTACSLPRSTTIRLATAIPIAPPRLRTILNTPAPGAREERPTACKVIRVTPLLRELIVTAASIEQDQRDDARERRIFELILDEIKIAAPLSLHVPMPRHATLARLCRELIAQPCGDVTLDQWAERAGMHPRTFARTLRRETAGCARRVVRSHAATAELATTCDRRIDSRYRARTWLRQSECVQRDVP